MFATGKLFDLLLIFYPLSTTSKKHQNTHQTCTTADTNKKNLTAVLPLLHTQNLDESKNNHKKHFGKATFRTPCHTRLFNKTQLLVYNTTKWTYTSK
jgi:hypothetical protein